MSSCPVPVVSASEERMAASEVRHENRDHHPKKKLIRRSDRDYSQQLRLGVQLAFLLLNIWIGIRFYQWVRWAETAGQTRAVERPAGVEGWLPIAGLMQLKYVIFTRQWPSVHPASLFLITAFLLMSFLLRKSFCSWLCPVGTFSEYLWKLGRFTFRRNFTLPRWMDVLLRGTKYLLLAFFAYAVVIMPAEAIAGFLSSPYGFVVDVRMLNFFRFLGGTAAFVVLALIVASLFVQNFWCRYLCPYGALMGLVSMLGPVRIRRNETTCIDCGKCAKACPSTLPVDQLVQIRSAECIGCLECVAVCPAQDALVLASMFGDGAKKPDSPSRTPRAIPAWSLAAALAIVFFGLVGYAKLSGHWDTAVPQQIYFELVSHASEVSHP